MLKDNEFNERDYSNEEQKSEPSKEELRERIQIEFKTTMDLFVRYDSSKFEHNKYLQHLVKYRESMQRKVRSGRIDLLTERSTVGIDKRRRSTFKKLLKEDPIADFPKPAKKKKKTLFKKLIDEGVTFEWSVLF